MEIRIDIPEDQPSQDKDRFGGVVASYTPEYPRQAAYLLALCTQEGIAAKYHFGGVRIFSKEKVKRFKELVQQSIRDRAEAQWPDLPLILWKNKTHKTICVGCSIERILYTHQNEFPRIVIAQYLGQIPVGQYIKIFNSEIELFEYLLTVRRVKCF